MKKILSILALMLFSVNAYSQVTLIVPFAPGGSFDVMARKLTPYLEKELQDKVTVLNVPGAGGAVGVSRLDSSNKTTILLAGPWLYTILNANNQPLNRYKYPGVVGEAYLYLAVSKKSGLTCEKIREQSQPLFLGSNGPKTISSLAIEIVKEKYSNITEVPYKGGGAQVVDIINGELSGTFLLSKASNRADLFNVLANTSSTTLDGIISWRECLGITKTLTNQYFMIANQSADDAFINNVNRSIRNFVRDPENKIYFSEEGIQPRIQDVSTTFKDMEKSFQAWGVK